MNSLLYIFWDSILNFRGIFLFSLMRPLWNAQGLSKQISILGCNVLCFKECFVRCQADSPILSKASAAEDAATIAAARTFPSWEVSGPTLLGRFLWPTKMGSWRDFIVTLSENLMVEPSKDVGLSKLMVNIVSQCLPLFIAMEALRVCTYIVFWGFLRLFVAGYLRWLMLESIMSPCITCVPVLFSHQFTSNIQIHSQHKAHNSFSCHAEGKHRWCFF